MSAEMPESSWLTFKRLVSYLKHFKLAFAIAILANLAYAAMDFLFIRAFEPITDEALISGNMELIKQAPYFIIAIILFRGVASFISSYCMAWVGQSIVQKLRTEMVGQYMSLPSRFYDENPSGKLVSKITYDTQQVALAVTDAITKFVREGGFIIYILIYLFTTSWKLTLLYLLAAPIIGIVVNISSKRFKNISRNIQNAMGGITQNAHEVVDGYKVIKIFGGESYESNRFMKEANNNRQQNVKLVATQAVSVAFIQLIAGSALALVLYYAGLQLENGELTPGQFVTMLLMMMAMLKPLKIISNLNSIIQKGIAAAQSIFDILDAEKEKDQGNRKIGKPKGEIKFNQVAFAYSDGSDKVLDDITFNVKSGQTFALVGRSGSGKSTLANLLARFYDPTHGQISLDEIDTQEIKLSNLREHISLVSQQVTLFNTSIAENIAYACEEIDRDKVKSAAIKAHAWEFIEKLEKGLDEKIGENGNKLSGGQRQRLVIARALYKNAPVVILDEATSALDTESERHIQAAFDSLTDNRTTLVIAHRLSTIENADCILVMDNGKIIEQGRHSELLAKNGFYKKLHSMQFQEPDQSN